MTALLVILGSVIAYLALGFTATRLALPTWIANATYHTGDRYWGKRDGYDALYHWKTRESDGVDRREVHQLTRRMFWGWPVYMWITLLTLTTAATIDKADPAVHAKQRQRIAELERELDMR